MFNITGHFGKLWVTLANCIKISLSWSYFFACGFMYEFMLKRTDDREGLIGENVYLRAGGAK